jgi:hypothetical protein
MMLRWMRRRRRGAEERARELLHGAVPLVLEDGASSFGVESGGRAQVRGNGVLAASHERLVFVMWLPRRELVIERASVLSVDATFSHLGKTTSVPGRRLLRVRFTGDDGEPDAVAWYTRNLEGWLLALGGWGRPAA